jgi:adenosylmethionine-8-amino-7-oxononanoate aminotransferase
VADKPSKRRFDPGLGLAQRISELAYANGIIFRAFNDNILGFAPALCYGADVMDILFERLGRTLDFVLDELTLRRVIG